MVIFVDPTEGKFVMCMCARIRHYLSIGILFAFLSIVLISCSGGSSDGLKSIQVLRIGVLPDDSIDHLREEFTLLVSYLSEELGVPCELVVPDSYEDFLANFRDKKLDLANFEGYTFVEAERKYGAVPLVMRDGDLCYTSYFLVKPDDTAVNLNQYKGKKFAFGERLSASGHIMPRYFMKEVGIVPEKHFSEVLYSEQHDTTAYWVRDGKVDIGIANHSIIDEMFLDGRLSEDDVKILFETRPYSGCVWAVSSEVDAEWQNKIKEAFLRLSANDDHDRMILESLEADQFYPARSRQFDELQKAITVYESAAISMKGEE